MYGTAKASAALHELPTVAAAVRARYRSLRVRRAALPAATAAAAAAGQQQAAQPAATLLQQQLDLPVPLLPTDVQL